jgi:hypothetical protein
MVLALSMHHDQNHQNPPLRMTTRTKMMKSPFSWIIASFSAVNVMQMDDAYDPASSLAIAQVDLS